MEQQTRSGVTPTPARSGDGNADRSPAVEAAAEAGSELGQQAKRVAGDAAAQARSVVDEATGQVRSLVGQAGQEARTQADQRAAQAAGALRTLSDQAEALAAGRPEEAGPLGGYLGDAGERLRGVATRLDERGIEGVVDDVSRFARRRPLVFLAVAAGAGFAVGRLVRAGARLSSEGQPNGDGYERALPIVTEPPVLPPPLAASTTGVVVP
jgi:hypothetical protein